MLRSKLILKIAGVNEVDSTLLYYFLLSSIALKDDNTISARINLKKFYSDNFLKELERKQKCPEYIGFKSCSGNYSAFESSRDKYLNYYKTLYICQIL
jgi:hypothetical protein